MTRDEFGQEYLALLRASVDGGRSLDVLSIDNRAHVTVFTSADQASAASAAGELDTVATRTLLAAVPDHVGFAVDPGGDLGLPAHAETLRQVAEGSTRLTAGARVRIRIPSVRSARRAWVAVDDQDPGLVIGVDLDPDSPDTRRVAVEPIYESA